MHIINAIIRTVEKKNLLLSSLWWKMRQKVTIKEVECYLGLKALYKVSGSAILLFFKLQIDDAN